MTGGDRTRSGLLLLLMLSPLLLGPAPGAVGSCSDDSSDSFVELSPYCQEREELICVRQALRKEITVEDRDDCRREVIELCASRSWPPDCRPTQRQANACLNALRSEDTLHIQEEDLDECTTKFLCTVRTEVRSIDAGMSP